MIIVGEEKRQVAVVVVDGDLDWVFAPEYEFPAEIQAEIAEFAVEQDRTHPWSGPNIVIYIVKGANQWLSVGSAIWPNGQAAGNDQLAIVQETPTHFYPKSSDFLSRFPPEAFDASL